MNCKSSAFPMLLLLVMSCLVTVAQNTVYHMDYLPQKMQYNPAFIPKSGFFISLPGVGGMSAGAYNTGFTYNELDNFLDNIKVEGYNPNEFVESIGSTNRFLSELKVNMFSVGFKLKERGYFAFNFSFKNTLSVDAEAEIAYLLADYEDLSISKFPLRVEGIDLVQNSYMSIGATYARKITENLTVGITPNINFNVAGIKTNDLRYEVDIDGVDEFGEVIFDETFEGEVLIGLPSEINRDAINGNVLELEEGILPDAWEDDLKVGDFFRNASFSLNLGASYKLDDWLFSASILNLGHSRYKQNAYRLSGNFDEIEVYEETVHFGIPTQLFVGGLYQFSPNWNCGLVANNNFYGGESNASVTLSSNGRIGRNFSASVSYTAGYKYNNLGLGFRLRFLPGTDFFCVTDNLIQAFSFKNSHRVTAMIGFNVVVGVQD